MDMAQVPRSVARFNRRVTNPIQMRWAPYLPPWAVIEHVGRRTGTRYSTPVIAAVDGGTLYVAVLYGPESDWVQNVLHAGGGHVRRAGRRFDLTAPEVGDARQAPGLAGRLGRVSGRVLSARLSPG
jgi:deazaflavin-dependent oxidoreductase (nitroreductase family)